MFKAGRMDIKMECLFDISGETERLQTKDLNTLSMLGDQRQRFLPEDPGGSTLQQVSTIDSQQSPSTSSSSDCKVSGYWTQMLSDSHMKSEHSPEDGRPNSTQCIYDNMTNINGYTSDPHNSYTNIAVNHQLRGNEIVYNSNGVLVYENAVQDSNPSSSSYKDVTLMPAPDTSISPPPPPRVYRPCVVCNDKSSGYHYGVSSCEGCKGFFRRSVQKNMQYTCHKDQNCVMNKVTRNRCQYCRLQKCFAKGMSKEAVRNDRNKKRKKSENESGGPNSQHSEDLTSQDQTLINAILKAHIDTFPEIKEDSKYKLTSEELKSEEKMILWERVSELSTEGVISIVDFGKKVPGFLDLPISDQITLLKSSCLELMILRLCSRFNDVEDTMTFSNGLELTRRQLEIGGFGALTDTIFGFASSLKNMEVDVTEFALLAAITLVSGDRSGLEQPAKIENLQDPILEALKHYVRNRRTSQPHFFAKILMKLTDLRSISVKGAEKVLDMRMEMPGGLPPLIIEMLDRSENVCIP